MYVKDCVNFIKTMRKIDNIKNDLTFLSTDFIDGKIEPKLDKVKEQVFESMFGITVDSFHQEAGRKKIKGYMMGDILTDSMYLESFQNAKLLRDALEEVLGD